MNSDADDQAVERALRETQTRLSSLEADDQLRRGAFRDGQVLLERLRKRRHRAVPVLEGAQRGAVRLVVLAVGCVAIITGATTLDSTFGGVAIAGTFGVLLAESLR